MWTNYGITCSLSVRSDKQETRGLPWNLGLGHSISSTSCMCGNLEPVR